jgi:hypothetical protein
VKFLVIWKIELSLLSSHVAAAVARMPAYAGPLERSGRIAARYQRRHPVGPLLIREPGPPWAALCPPRAAPCPARPAAPCSVSA